MFKRILAPVDGSDASFRALDIAVDIAGKYKSELDILCVYRHHSSVAASLSMGGADAGSPKKALKEYATEVINSAKKRASGAGAKTVKGFVKSGQPSRSIVAFAKEHDIDLIVIGGRGTGDVEGFLLGSVSHKVTSLAHCPCLTT